MGYQKVNDMTEVELIEEIIDAELGYSWDKLEDESIESLRALVRDIRGGQYDNM